MTAVRWVVEHPGAAQHGYTDHGHPCCNSASSESAPDLVARCGGPGLCQDCRASAAHIHAQRSGTGGWIEYPDERTARAHAGTAATVWALVPAEAADVLTAARQWWATENLPASLLDDQETALGRAVAALDRITTPTQPTGIPHSAAGSPTHPTLNSGTNPARSPRHGQTNPARGASEANS